jgi:hypothetical protein
MRTTPRFRYAAKGYPRIVRMDGWDKCTAHRTATAIDLHRGSRADSKIFVEHADTADERNAHADATAQRPAHINRGTRG